MNRKERNQVLDALVARDDIEIVHEPKLTGPFGTLEWKAGHPVALYPRTQAARDWLLSHDKLVNRKGRVEPAEGFEGKYYLQSDAFPDLSQRSYNVAEVPFGHERPLTLDHLPANTRLAISPVRKTSGGHTHALLLAVPAHAREPLIARLRESGLLARNEGERAGYALFVVPESSETAGGDMAVCAIPLDTDVAASLLANPHTGIESWIDGLHGPMDAEKYALHELVVRAAPYLEPPVAEQQEVTASPQEEQGKNVQQANSAPALPGLRSKTASLRGLNPKIVYEPHVSGKTYPWLEMDNNPQVINDLMNGARTHDPLKGGRERSVGAGRVRVQIGREEMERLESLMGALPVGEALPLDKRPLKSFFHPRHDAVSKRDIGVAHVAFARVDARQEGQEPRHVMYVAASAKSRFVRMIETLQLPTNATALLTHDEERPGLLRFDLPKATWEALQVTADQAVEQGRTKRLTFEEGAVAERFSLQGLDAEMRETMGIATPQSERKDKKPQEVKPKLTNGDAIAFLGNELAKIEPAKLALATVARIKTGSKQPVAEQSLFIRGRVGDLNGLMNQLDRETDMFARNLSVRLLSDRTASHANGLLEIVVSTPILEKLSGMVTLPKPSPQALSQDTYRSSMNTVFMEREAKEVQRSEQEMAWSHLRKFYMEPVAIHAPDRAKLDQMKNELEQLRGLSQELNAPLDALGSIEERFASVLKTLAKDDKGDHATQRELTQMKRRMRVMQRELGEGLPAAVTDRISLLERHYRQLEEMGTRIEYVMFDVEKRTDEVLQPLIGNDLLAVSRTDEGASSLRIVPRSADAFAGQLRRAGHTAPSYLNARRLADDELAEWAKERSETLQARKEQAQTLAAAPAAVPATATADAPKQKAEKTPADHWMPTRNTGKLMRECLNRTSGLLAWERQEPNDPNLPTEGPIGLQPVIAMKVGTHDELMAVQKLYKGLRDAGLLLESPRFYGEIVDAAQRAQPEPEEPVVSADTAALEARIDNLDNMYHRVKEITFHAARQHDAFSRTLLPECISELAKEMKRQEDMEPRGAKRLRPEWYGLLEKVVTRECPVETILQAEPGLRNDLHAAKMDLHATQPEQPRHVPFHMRQRASGYVTSVQQESDLIFPVDGKAGSGLEETQLRLWHEQAKRKTPHGRAATVPAVKLYLDPEKLDQILPLMDGIPTIENLTERTQSRPLSQDEVTHRMSGLMQQQETLPFLSR